VTTPVTAVEPAVVFKVNVVAVIVDASIDSEKVTETVVFLGTLIAPSAGLVGDTTVGGVVSTVNEKLKLLANAFPARSFTPVVTVAVYCVLFTSGADGVKDAVFVAAVYETVPVTSAEVAVTRSVTVVALIVVGSIGSLNVMVIGPPVADVVEPAAGDVDTTVGGVVSGPVPVMNVHSTCAVRALPARSFAPVVIRAVYVVLGRSGPVGVNVAVLVAAL